MESGVDGRPTPMHVCLRCSVTSILSLKAMQLFALGDGKLQASAVP